MFGKIKKMVIPVVTLVSLASMLAGCIIAPAPGYYHPYHPYYGGPHYYYYR
jgi:hypothetical protein